MFFSQISEFVSHISDFFSIVLKSFGKKKVWIVKLSSEFWKKSELWDINSDLRYKLKIERENVWILNPQNKKVVFYFVDSGFGHFISQFWVYISISTSQLVTSSHFFLRIICKKVWIVR